MGQAFLYILVAAGPEDVLKVGMTHDPLARWPAFHPRWFEAFDLGRSMLVETERRADARALETRLHRLLRQHRCPMPLTMRAAVGGATEWYRGANEAARAFIEGCEAEGYVVARDSTPYLASAMRRQSDLLSGMLQHAHEELLRGSLANEQRCALVDLIDGHLLFDPGIEERLPAEAWEALRPGGAGAFGSRFGQGGTTG